MILRLNTKTKEINKVYEVGEEETKQSHVDLASMLILAIVDDAKESYTSTDLQKLYIDILSAYAKRYIDPENESDNLDVATRIEEIQSNLV